ncbi:MAG: O-antigen ligase family protein [Proteobacteria bacterium]|nr:O-antigen ligase family protein [Pseudomonadota bacterium]
MRLSDKKQSNELHPVFEVARYGAFIGFYILSIRIVFVAIYNAAPMVSPVIGAWVLAMAFLSRWNIQWALFGFILGVPFVSGMHVIGVIPLAPFLSLGFAGLYLIWLPKRLFLEKKGLDSPTGIGSLIDILSGIVMLSLVFTLWPYPGDMVSRRLFLGPFIGQQDAFYCLDGSFVLLQGLFFFRVMELEIKESTTWRKVAPILYLQSAIILFFAMFQLIFRTPGFHIKTDSIFSPFDDPHSFGSYMAFLFLFFLACIHKKAKDRWLCVGLACATGLLFFLSGSRVAWIAGACVGMLFFIRKMKVAHRILLVLALLIPLVFINLFPSLFSKSENRFVQRIDSILVAKNYLKFDWHKVLKGRLIWWDRGLNMVGEHPVTGRGIGSFYSVSPSYAGPEYKKYQNRKENAHNYYLQLAADLGIPALLIFIAILYYTYKAGILSISRGGKDKNLVTGLLLGLGAYLLTMITGHPLLLSNQQFLFWFILATISISYSSSTGKRLFNARSRRFNALLCVLAVLLAVGYGCRLYDADPRLKIREFGFYGHENWGAEKMRWTWKKSLTNVKATSNIFGIKVVAASHNSAGPEGLEFRLFANDRLLEHVHFFNGGERFLRYWVPSVDGREIQVRTEVSKTFNPFRIGLSQDNRDLGVGVSPIKFLKIILSDGLGFYQWEVLGNREIPGWPQDSKPKFRWGGMRASINLSDKFIDITDAIETTITLYLLCSHPDIHEKPVSVTIIGDEGSVREEIFGDHQWKKVVLDLEDFKKSRVMTFQVSRTWNPKLAGVSEDGRDLGVAIAVLENGKTSRALSSP